MRTIGLITTVTLLLVGCSFDLTASDETTTTSTSSVSAVPRRGTASTIEQSSSTASSTTTTEADSTTEAESTPATTTATTATTAPATTAAAGEVITPGRSGAFTSPTGNIACVMGDDTGVSCFIAEKSWTIEAPTDPSCEFDFGNVISLLGDDVIWACYSDLFWDPNAPALAYGDSMLVGPYLCESARTGVTCRNGSGTGFNMARAAATIY